MSIFINHSTENWKEIALLLKGELDGEENLDENLEQLEEV